ncbi:hypothetical protein D3C76_905790 [compost metagenome]
MVRQEITNHRVARRQAQHATGADVRQRAVQCVIDAAQNHVGPIQEVPPGIGQAHALGRALEQQRTEDALQFLDRRGHRRLGNIQVNRGLGYLPDLGGGDEITDLAQGQGHEHSG